MKNARFVLFLIFAVAGVAFALHYWSIANGAVPIIDHVIAYAVPVLFILNERRKIPGSFFFWDIVAEDIASFVVSGAFAVIVTIMAMLWRVILLTL